MNKLNEMAIRLMRMRQELKDRARKALTEERGDTNFVAMIVIIGIILVVAVVFRERLKEAVNAVFDNVDSWTGSNTGN